VDRSNPWQQRKEEQDVLKGRKAEGDFRKHSHVVTFTYTVKCKKNKADLVLNYAPHHKATEGVEVKLHLLFISVLDGGKWLALDFDHFNTWISTHRHPPL
jgi:hypothetical protein